MTTKAAQWRNKNSWPSNNSWPLQEFFETIEDACVHRFYSNDEAVYRIGTVLYGHWGHVPRSKIACIHSQPCVPPDRHFWEQNHMWPWGVLVHPRPFTAVRTTSTPQHAEQTSSVNSTLDCTLNQIPQRRLGKWPQQEFLKIRIESVITTVA